MNQGEHFRYPFCFDFRVMGSCRRLTRSIKAYSLSSTIAPFLLPFIPSVHLPSPLLSSVTFAWFLSPLFPFFLPAVSFPRSLLFSPPYHLPSLHSSSPTSPPSSFYPYYPLSPLILPSGISSIPIPKKPLHQHSLLYSPLCSSFDKQLTQFFKCLF